MSKVAGSRRHRARSGALWALLLAAASALGALLLGCAGQPPEPTRTPVPLAATATRGPQPSRVPATATDPLPTVAATASQAAPPGNSAAAYSATDEALARSTVEDLLARLVRGDIESAARLYLSVNGRAAGLDTRLADLAQGDRRLTQATLLALEPEPPSSYRAQAVLRRAGGEQEVAETLNLVLVYERGLWLVDALSVSDSPSPTDLATGGAPRAAATPTPGPARPAGSAAGGREAAPALTGRIVFQRSSGGNIYVVNADGSALQRVADGLDPAWSPTGNRIAFTRWHSPWGVYLIRPDGGGEERVVDGNQFKEVAWAPDGRRLAFTLNQGSSGPQQVCFWGYCFTIPAYSLGQIWVADLDSGELESLPVADQVVHSPTWAPSGQRIVYAGERGLAWFDLTSRETGRFESSSAWDGSPAYSPDGQRITFMGRAHDRWEIFVMNADGGGRRQLTESERGAMAPGLDEPPHNVAPAWSPDGRRIAFLSNRDGRWRIYAMNADGTRQRPMFTGAPDEIEIVYDWASERVISWGSYP